MYNGDAGIELELCLQPESERGQSQKHGRREKGREERYGDGLFSLGGGEVMLRRGRCG